MNNFKKIEYEIKNKLTFVFGPIGRSVHRLDEWNRPSHGFGDENQNPAHQVYVPQRPYDGVGFRQRLSTKHLKSV